LSAPVRAAVRIASSTLARAGSSTDAVRWPATSARWRVLGSRSCRRLLRLGAAQVRVADVDPLVP
jgi:hypothetical protein